jgi:TolB-like protein
MQFQDTDWADSNKVAQLGYSLGANCIFRGKLMSLADQTVISVAILDINTAQILSSSTLQLLKMEEVFAKLPGLAKKVAANLPRSSQPAASQVLTMAVSPFDIRSGLSADELEVFMELFIAEFVTRGMKVVDRNIFDRIIAEIQFQESDWADSKKVAQLGRALNANSIIRGTVISLAGRTTINATILDINTAEILSKATMIINNKNSVFSSMPSFALEMKLGLPTRLGGGGPKIGDTGPAGGIVFYDKGDYSNGWRFIEAAPAAFEFSVSADDGFSVKSDRLRALTVNGFTGWYGPSKEDLNLMYVNLKQKGLGGFRNDLYVGDSSGDILNFQTGNWLDLWAIIDRIRFQTHNGRRSYDPIMYLRPIRRF